MVQEKSRLVVADNSGAKIIEVIRVMGSTGKRFAGVGDRIKCAVKSASPDGTVKKGQVITAVVVRVAKETRLQDGSYIRFDENAAVVINNETGEPIGTRVFGPVPRALRSKKGVSSKILSLAPEVL